MTNDVINKVLYDVDQRSDTTEGEKKTARDNIGAAAAADVPSITTTTEGPDETYVVPVSHLDFNMDDFSVKAGASTLGTLVPRTTPTEQRVLTLDANDPVPYWAVSSGGGSEEVFIATYGSTTYQQVSNALTSGKMVVLRYGGADIPISSSTSSRHAFLQVRREGHSYAQQADSTRVFILNSDDTWEMNSVPVAYNVLAGAGLTYMVNGNDLTLSVSASFMPDLNLLTNNQVNINSDTTLNIEAGNAYHIRVTTASAPVITLSTTSTTTIHSLISVKNESATSCTDITIRFNDETGYTHDVDLMMYETSSEYDFYVDIRKVNSTVIARVYDLPCMWRQGWMGSPSYQNNTGWIGYVR